MNQSLRVRSGSQLHSATTLRWHIPLTAAYILTHCALHSLPCLLPHHSNESYGVPCCFCCSYSISKKPSTPVSTYRLWVYDPLRGGSYYLFIITPHSLLYASLWAVTRSKTRHPNINTALILYLHNNPFHMSWLTKLWWRKAADKKMIKSQKKDQKNTESTVM